MAQEVIKQALQNQKLAPSIHSKLVAFQKKQQEKTQTQQQEKAQTPSPALTPTPEAKTEVELKVGDK